jgi:4-hydroxyphenylpyruvate dioxygenase
VHFSIATVSMGGPLIERFRAASDAGFNGIEIFWDDYVHSGWKASELRQALVEFNLSADVLQPVRGFEGDSIEIQANRFADARRFFDIACELGAPIVGITANEKQSAGGPEAAAEMLRALAESAQQYGLLIAYESLAWSHRIVTFRDVCKAVTLADSANLGVVVDSFHFCISNDDVSSIAEIEKDKIFLLQLSDAKRIAGLTVKEISRHHRCFPGDGELPIEELVAICLGRGYDGNVTVELFNDLYRSMPADEVARTAYRALRNALHSNHSSHFPT